MITVEYLAIAKKTNSFCNSTTSFNNLMEVDSTIVIDGNKLHFDKYFSCNYEILSNEIKDKEERYFHQNFRQTKILMTRSNNFLSYSRQFVGYSAK